MSFNILFEVKILRFVNECDLYYRGNFVIDIINKSGQIPLNIKFHYVTTDQSGVVLKIAAQYDRALKLDLKTLSLEEAMYGGWVLSNHPLLSQLIRDRSELIKSLFSVSPLVDSSESKQQNSEAEDPVTNMEEGTGNESDTTAHMLMEGLKKQRRSSQGYPEHAIVDSDEEDIVEKEDYLKGKMKTQRSLSQVSLWGLSRVTKNLVWWR